MPRHKPKTTTLQRKTVREIVPTAASRSDILPETPIPWYAGIAPASAKRMKTDALVEMGATVWLRRLVNVAKKLSLPLIDPTISRQEKNGALFMRWENGERGAEVVVTENDAIGTLFHWNSDTQEEYSAIYQNFSQGSVKEIGAIEIFWRWITYIDEKPDVISEALRLVGY